MLPECHFIIPAVRYTSDNIRFLNVTSYCRAMYGELLLLIMKV